METKLIPQNRSMFKALGSGRMILRPRHGHHHQAGTVAVLSSTSTDKNIATDCRSTGILEKTVYTDNQFDRIAIEYLSQSVQVTTGMRNSKRGYESLVEAATAISLNFNPAQQRQIVSQALEKAFPKPILSLIRMILPQSKFTRELFAAFTSVFFVWLIGPCERVSTIKKKLPLCYSYCKVKESERNGRKERNVVHIKQCRFLEQTNCVGMCTNLCKMPSQTFIKNFLGMPLNMVPNFDDMSCEMIFGEEPPAMADDPAFKQPCYKLCKANQKHNIKCST